MYSHKRLKFQDSIRLIEIHPAAFSESISCTILEARLEADLVYEAVSYTWGDVEDPRIIKCSEAQESLYVTKNCESVLKRLRNETMPRRVWLDAISIDQTNIEERNTQVAMMGQIYGMATRVVIDIGEQSEIITRKSSYGFETEAIELTGSNIALDFLSNHSQSTIYGFGPGLFIRREVTALFRRPWFKRIWVLQEAYMSKDAVVLCGTRVVPWAIVRPISIWHAPHDEQELWHPTLPTPIPPVLAVGMNQHTTYETKRDFLDILCMARICEATDPRDKVFALLPFLKDASRMGLLADYAKSTRQVYTEVATLLLLHSGLSFLSCVRTPSEHDLPSWVPSWAQLVRKELIIWLSGMFHPLNASKDTAAVANIEQSPIGRPMLKVRGLAVDIIRTSSDVMRGIHEYDDILQYVSKAIKYRASKATIMGKYPVPKYREPKSREGHGRLKLPEWAIHHGLPFKWAYNDTDNECSDKMMHFASGQRLIQTERGFFGVAPSSSQPGDVVCVFLGAGVPFVIRREERSYTFIGEAYVYELMDGGALDDKDATKSFQDFCLV